MGPPAVRKYMVLVADNYSLVTPLKRDEQARRSARSTASLAKYHSTPRSEAEDKYCGAPPRINPTGVLTKAQIDQLIVTDTECPNNVYINASSALVFKVITYLIGRMSIACTNEDRCAVYVSCPSQKEGCPAAVHYASGQNIRLTKDGPDPPAPFLHGEGEIEAWLWTKVLRGWGVEGPIIIKSLDNDNFGIALAVPPEYCRGVYVELKPRRYDAVSKRDPKRLKVEDTRRAIDCGALASKVRSREEAYSLVLVANFAKSDFCAGPDGSAPIPGVGPGTLLPVFTDLSPTLCKLDGDKDEVVGNEKAIYAYIAECIRRRRRDPPCELELKALAPIVKSGIWCVNYWASIFNGKPQPGM